jgi:hypothetical protein
MHPFATLGAGRVNELALTTRKTGINDPGIARIRPRDVSDKECPQLQAKTVINDPGYNNYPPVR